MLFNSIEFIFIFLPLAVIVYFILLKKHLLTASKAWLIAASIFFYNWWNPKYTPVLLFSIIFNFAAGNSLSGKKIKIKFPRKSILVFSIIVNLAVLGYFKYMNFFIGNINSVFNAHIPFFKIVLPLGISFFTFQQITYLCDSYKNLTKEYDFLNYALFVSFFPGLIAGPIVHHKEIMPQFSNIYTKVLKNKNLSLGLFLFIIGLAKKVILADTFSAYVATGYCPHTDISIVEGWLIMLSYTFQIYFDFSGYTDMALGISKMLNIELPQNFNSPYKSSSIQDFWRRWHMTLSRFLRDYVYIPLGGSRNGESKTYVNLFLTFLLGGLWHGASWMFVIWGALHGTALCAHRFWKKLNIELPYGLSVFATFLFVNITWIFFRAADMNQAKKILKSLVDFTNFKIPETYVFTVKFSGEKVTTYEGMWLMIAIAFFIVFIAENSGTFISKVTINSKKKAVLLGVVFAVLFTASLIKMIYVPYSEFIYFNF